MKIYRIQDEDGRGMYEGGPGTSIMGYNKMRHPLPGRDSRLDWDSISVCSWKWIFGFASIAQMRSWVYDDFWFDQLYSKGFQVYEIDVPDEFAIIGNSQAIFLRDKFTNARVMTIEEVLK